MVIAVGPEREQSSALGREKDFGDGPAAGEAERRGRERKRNELGLVLLKLIVDQPRHGYGSSRRSRR